MLVYVVVSWDCTEPGAGCSWASLFVGWWAFSDCCLFQVCMYTKRSHPFTLIDKMPGRVHALFCTALLVHTFHSCCFFTSLFFRVVFSLLTLYLTSKYLCLLWQVDQKCHHNSSSLLSSQGCYFFIKHCSIIDRAWLMGFPMTQFGIF